MTLLLSAIELWRASKSESDACLRVMPTARVCWAVRATPSGALAPMPCPVAWADLPIEIGHPCPCVLGLQEVSFLVRPRDADQHTDRNAPQPFAMMKDCVKAKGI